MLVQFAWENTIRYEVRPANDDALVKIAYFFSAFPANTKHLYNIFYEQPFSVLNSVSIVFKHCIYDPYSHMVFVWFRH